MLLKSQTGNTAPLEVESFRRTRSCVTYVLLALVAGASATAQQVPIDTARSAATVHVYKSGLFSGLAHNHVIKAPIASGTLDVEHRRVELAFKAVDMKVIDVEGSDSERLEIETTMKGPKVLDASRFPDIIFASQAIKVLAPDHYEVTGELKLHGVTRPLTVTVAFVQGHYTASLKLKQTDFGIEPVKIAGGAVKVKDEIELSFEIVAKAS
jgi:polyisoprenoid-binding protein YceI